MTLYDEARKIIKIKVPLHLGQEAFLAQVKFAEDNKDEEAVKRTLKYLEEV